MVICLNIVTIDLDNKLELHTKYLGDTMYKMSNEELILNIKDWEKRSEHIESIIPDTNLWDSYNVEWIGHGQIRIKEKRFLRKDKIIYETPKPIISKQIQMLKDELNKKKVGSLAWEIEFHKSTLKHKIKNAQKIAKKLSDISEWEVKCNHCHKSYRHGEYEATEYNLFICPNCGATNEDITEVLMPKLTQQVL